MRPGADADLIARDRVNVDIFWLKGDTLDGPDLLPPPAEIAAEFVENLVQGNIHPTTTARNGAD